MNAPNAKTAAAFARRRPLWRRTCSHTELPNLPHFITTATACPHRRAGKSSWPSLVRRQTPALLPESHSQWSEAHALSVVSKADAALAVLERLLKGREWMVKTTPPADRGSLRVTKFIPAADWLQGYSATT